MCLLMQWAGVTGIDWTLRDEKAFERCQQVIDTKFISVEKRTDISMGLDFICTRTW